MPAVLRRWVASWPRMRRRYVMPTFAMTKKEHCVVCYRLSTHSYAIGLLFGVV